MKKYFAEFLGTLILVLIACGAAGFSGGIGGYVGTFGIAAAFGMTYLIVWFLINNISGCHINPAVSVAMYLRRKISTIDFFGYVIAQMLGGMAGALMLKGITFAFDSQMMQYYEASYGISFSTIGTNGYGLSSAVGINMWGALAVEMVLTCIFVLTVLAVVENEAYKKYAGFAIAIALFAVHIIGIPLTGTSVNPARSFGPAFITFLFGDAVPLAQEWVFVAAPLIGAIIAVGIWMILSYTYKADESVKEIVE